SQYRNPDAYSRSNFLNYLTPFSNKIIFHLYQIVSICTAIYLSIKQNIHVLMDVLLCYKRLSCLVLFLFLFVKTIPAKNRFISFWLKRYSIGFTTLRTGNFK